MRFLVQSAMRSGALIPAACLPIAATAVTAAEVAGAQARASEPVGQVGYDAGLGS